MSEYSEKRLLIELSILLANRINGRVSADDVCVALHSYLLDFGRWPYEEIADEARRVWNLMFHDQVQKGSAMDAVWTAAAAQAADGAYAAVASAIGVEGYGLREAVEPWLLNQDSPPSPISPQELFELSKAWSESI